MRVAFLLHGIVGGVRGKGGKGNLVDYRFCRDRFFENIIEPTNADVFIHSWSVDQKDELIEIYSPKKVVFEKQKIFHAKKKLHRMYSRFYSTQKAMNLKSAYEKENNFKYDFVMITRFDLIWHTLIDFKKLDSRKFYIGKWNVVNYDSKEVSPLFQSGGYKFNDLYFISNSEFMNYYGRAFKALKTFGSGDPHKFIKWYLLKNSELRNNIKFAYLKYYDHDNYRDRVESYKNGVTILKENFKVVKDLPRRIPSKRQALRRKRQAQALKQKRRGK